MENSKKKRVKRKLLMPREKIGTTIDKNLWDKVKEKSEKTTLYDNDILDAALDLYFTFDEIINSYKKYGELTESNKIDILELLIRKFGGAKE